MYRFPKLSVVPEYAFVKYDFGTGLGYHVSSAASRAMLSRLSTLISDTTNEMIILPPKVNRANATEYVRQLMSNHERIQHTAMNVERHDMYDLDHFFASVEMTLDPSCYASVAATVRGGRHCVKFQRLPFQQFMMLDCIMTMINRSGLSQYRTQILLHIKSSLGYDWLTYSKVEQLEQLFSKRVVGNNVRRRMGKSVAVYADLARSLAFYPRAGIKALYTVHKAPAADACHSVVASAVQEFVELFNGKQKHDFQRRIDARGGTVDLQDFFYQAKCTVLYNATSIAVAFYKMNRNGDCNSGKPVSKNTLRCKGYTQQDVSIFLMVSLYCVYIEIQSHVLLHLLIVLSLHQTPMVGKMQRICQEETVGG